MVGKGKKAKTKDFQKFITKPVTPSIQMILRPESILKKKLPTTTSITPGLTTTIRKKKGERISSQDLPKEWIRTLTKSRSPNSSSVAAQG